MVGFIVTLVVGVICIILGISNMRGNISSLHSYHRSRVREEDVLPFGRIVGLGTTTIGASIIVFGILLAIGVALEKNIYTVIGTAIMLIGMVVGIVVTFYGMKKYNGGIF